jgi:hypothetical protein
MLHLLRVLWEIVFKDLPDNNFNESEMRLSAIAMSKIGNDFYISFLILGLFVFSKYKPVPNSV